MKKLLIILAFIPLASLGQTLEETVYFIKSNVKNWACEPLLQGSFKDRLEINVNNGLLIILMRMKTDMFNTTEYFRNEIDLNQITKISVQENDAQCSAIEIHTSPGGIKVFIKKIDNSSEVRWNQEKEFFESIGGYVNDAIILKKNEYFIDRSNRMVEALYSFNL